MSVLRPDPAPGPAATSEADALHRRIALLAHERGYVTLATMADALLDAGADPSLTPLALWVRSGRLDRTELAEILNILQPGEPLLSGPMEAVKRESGRLPVVGALPAVVHTPPATADEDSSRSLTLADVMETYGFDRPLTSPGSSGAQPARTARERAHSPVSGDTAVVAGDRYLVGNELGRGAVGRVVKAFDRFLGRNVAMKRPLSWPLPRDQIERFIEEAQATGQLEHPNIVPVYDVGQLGNGELYYTMKRVRSRSLRDALDALRAGDEEAVEEYGQTRLLSIFLKVALAIHYAHSRGVIHRDLKPDNIMLGEYGEVHVMDWGLARVKQQGVMTERGLRTRTPDGPGGQTVGTPAYMPPEQAQGRLDEVDERSDVYALGVILYELLTLQQPSTRSTVMETLMAVIADPIPPPRRAAPDRDIPEDLERIVMRALEKEPSKRWRTAKALHDAVEKFLDGRNDREAQRHLYEGERHFRLYEQARDEMVRLDEAVRELSARIEEWEPPEHKRSLWQLEDMRHEAAGRMVRKFGDALREFTQSLAYLPRYQPALHAVSRLIWSRYRVAERDNNPLDLIIYENLLRQYDDGTWLSRIDDPATLTVETRDATPAEVFFAPFTERDRIQRLGTIERIGIAPVTIDNLKRGSYLIRVKAPGRPAVSVPLHIRRSDPHAIVVDLPERDAAPRDFVYIPGGPTIVGGDPGAFDPLPWQVVDVEAFHIMRYPVTFGDYLVFIDDLAQHDPDAAEARAPRTRDADGQLVLRGPDGRYAPAAVLIEGPMRALYPAGAGHEWRLAVLAISYEDAVAYADWRSRREGRTYRLPTEFQWERAARGADGRRFPWGNIFDATFCKMNASRPMPSQPEPVGSYPIDRSVFDVFDLAGNVREYVRAERPDDPEVITKGGSWNADARACRAATRLRTLRESRIATIGFRLVTDAGR